MYSVEKNREYQREWYRKNSSRKIALSRSRVSKYKTLIREYKSEMGCYECGVNNGACLDFHHKNKKEKIIAISLAIVHKNWGKDKLLNEASKCIVLCSNCHRKHHSIN